jgi:sulfur carrier protein ThiS
MRVRVVPVAELKRQLLPNGGSALWLDLPEGTTVGDVLRRLDVKVQDRLIVGLDGAYATPDTPLRDNAELTLVTPMEGGCDGERILEPHPAG